MVQAALLHIIRVDGDQGLWKEIKAVHTAVLYSQILWSHMTALWEKQTEMKVVIPWKSSLSTTFTIHFQSAKQQLGHSVKHLLCFTEDSKWNGFWKMVAGKLSLRRHELIELSDFNEAPLNGHINLFYLQNCFSSTHCLPLSIKLTVVASQSNHVR